jgi:hypothetical protein
MLMNQTYGQTIAVFILTIASGENYFYGYKSLPVLGTECRELNSPIDIYTKLNLYD